MTSRNPRFPLERRGERKKRKKDGERTHRSSARPLGADKPAATRSISRKKDRELYRSIRLPASMRLRIQLLLSAGAIYRETNGDASVGVRECIVSKDSLQGDLFKMTSYNENVVRLFSTVMLSRRVIEITKKKCNVEEFNNVIRI